MSVSIDEHPADGQESATGVLTGWLDDYQAGRCERADLEEAFLSICASNEEAPWAALSLLDRYQRLGRIDAEFARTLKARISQQAVGAPPQPAVPPTPRAPSAQPPAANHDTQTHDIALAPKGTPSSAPYSRGRLDAHAARDDDEVEEDDFEEEDLDEVPEPLPPRPAARVEAFPSGRTARWPASTAARAPTRPPRAPTPAAAPRASESSGRESTGRRVLRDRYELLGVLSQGQTSTIYKALDRHRANLSEAARYVAVKVFNPTYASDPNALAALEREFHQAQSLSHPNIAKVFDLDRDGDTHFVVMELLEGQSLASVLHRLGGRPMARRHALWIIGAVGAALAHAHRRNIVHGDLKPRNIMITSAGEVRVLEFGFARSRVPRSGELDGEQGVVVIGTPAYASAERVHGMEPDASDDVYSLACIAYELLSGRHPYGGRSAFLARADGRRPQRVPGLSGKQWHALSRALAWDRADRRIDVQDLIAALGANETHPEPVPPQLLAIPEDTRAARVRRTLGVLAVIVVVVTTFFLVTRIPPPVQSIDSRSALSLPQSEDTTPPLGDGAATEPSSNEGVSQEAASAPANGTSSESTEPARATAPAAPTQQQSAAEPGTSAANAPVRSESWAGPVTIELSQDTYIVNESEPAVMVEVRRRGSTRLPVSLRWSLHANSAEAGEDYADIGPGVEQIPAGARSVTIPIPIVNDAIPESTELFLIEIESLDEHVEVGAIGSATVIIVDDD